MRGRIEKKISLPGIRVDYERGRWLGRPSWVLRVAFGPGAGRVTLKRRVRGATFYLGRNVKHYQAIRSGGPVYRRFAAIFTRNGNVFACPRYW